MVAFSTIVIVSGLLWLLILNWMVFKVGIIATQTLAQVDLAVKTANSNFENAEEAISLLGQAIENLRKNQQVDHDDLHKLAVVTHTIANQIGITLTQQSLRDGAGN